MPRRKPFAKWSGNITGIPPFFNIDKIKFTLVGFVQHIGQNFASGHYVSYVKYGDKWWYCNDAFISNETSDGQKHDWKAALPQAYILLYDKLSNPCHALCTSATCAVGSCDPAENCCYCGNQDCPCKKATT